MKIPEKALQALIKIVGKENLFTDEASLLLHAYDCSLSRTRPDLLINLTKERDVSPVLKILHHYHIPFVPRAGATNHAGSCTALNGGAILNLMRLNKILQIDTKAGFAIAQAGAITGDLQNRLNALGFFYAPDPASERVCTLGGNLAQNASGARCMKYGGTLDHILEADIVLPDGTPLHFSRENRGPDFVGLLSGSEGTLGILTRLKVKILPIAKHIKTFLVTFPSLADSVQTVTDLAARGIIPRCVEAMDQVTTQAIEDFSHAGYPKEAQALLILELDGTPTQIEQEEKELFEVCQKNHAQEFIPAQSEQDRQRLWLGRKAAYAAMARLAPNVAVGDGTVPRSELPRALAIVRQILEENNIYASLLFHAGDGNFHPQIIFDERNKSDAQRVSRALKQILQACVDCGGTVSGEHGIGVEKRAVMAYQYDKPTLDLFRKIKKAFDPQNTANPLKIIPLSYAERTRAAQPVSDTFSSFLQQVKTLVQKGEKIIPVGNNSRNKIPGETLLSTKPLNRILEIDTANYTVTAEAGISLDSLHRNLDNAGVYSLLPQGDSGTLGGLFSSGDLPEFYPHVLGIEAILPDGSVVRYGGKLMKNAAGYNLIRLFAGAQGTFGIVTRLIFKVFAKPPVSVIPHSFEKAEACVVWKALKKELDPLTLFPILPEEGKHA